MPNQESTAINNLIDLVQGRRLEVEDQDHGPDLFEARLRPAPAPRTDPALRIASGTNPPPIAQVTPSVPLAPQTAQKKVYRIPVVEQDEEQTALWNHANELDTAPAVPSIAPHAATVIASAHTPAVPAILRGPIGPENPVDRAAAARAAQYAEERARALQARHQPAPRSHPQHHPAPHHSRAMQAVTGPSRAQPAVTPLSQLPYPAYAIPVAPPSSAKPASPASWLIAREVLTSWGTLAVIAVVALGLGVYAAIATAGDKPAAASGPTERDRAIAIMNGTAQPEPAPVHTIVHAPVPAAATAEPIEAAPVTTPRPASFEAVTADPIDEAAEEPAAVATAEDVVSSSSDEAIDPDAIEIEPMNARPSKRASSSASRRAARKAKRLAKAELRDQPSRARRTDDPVLAILNEKPKRAKKVKEPTGAAISIAAPKGALAGKGTGKVTITSDVAAVIYLDGRPTGKTAPTALVIPAGDHQITLLDPASKKAKTATVQLAANKAVAIRKDFR